MHAWYVYIHARSMCSGSHRKDRYEYIISDLTRGAKNEEKEKRERQRERGRDAERRKGKKHFRLERIMFCHECFSLLGSHNGVDISSSAEKL